MGVGYVPEGRRVFANLTVHDNLRVPIERPGPFTIERIYHLFPRLEERRASSAGSFPAASRRCCRSPARFWSIPGC